MRAQQTILPVLDQRVPADIGQVPAHEREMVIAIRLADRPDSIEGGFVPDMAAKGVARVGGIDDHTAAAQAIDRLTDVAPLRRNRMKLQVDTHESEAMITA
jgi:hypothetical protein